MTLDLYSGGLRLRGYSACKVFASVPDKENGWSFDIAAGQNISCAEPTTLLYNVGIDLNHRSVFNIIIYDDVSMYQAVKEFRQLVRDTERILIEPQICAMRDTLIKYAFDLLFAEPDGAQKLSHLFEGIYKNGLQNGEAILQSKMCKLLGL